MLDISDLLRYALNYQKKDSVTVEEEMEIVSSYISLNKIHLKDNVVFEVQVDEEMKDTMIPPMSIQLLVENAIKHNLATVDKPITIEVYNDKDILIVKNNLQKKKYLPRERKATGIENIKKRYEFFTDKILEVVESDDSFIVKLPLIDIEYAD